MIARVFLNICKKGISICRTIQHKFFLAISLRTNNQKLLTVPGHYRSAETYSGLQHLFYRLLLFLAWFNSLIWFTMQLVYQLIPAWPREPVCGAGGVRTPAVILLLGSQDNQLFHEL